MKKNTFIFFIILPALLLLTAALAGCSDEQNSSGDSVRQKVEPAAQPTEPPLDQFTKQPEEEPLPFIKESSDSGGKPDAITQSEPPVSGGEEPEQDVPAFLKAGPSN